MNTREAMEKYLEQNPDDQTARNALVDLLDEEGNHEEAERHRKFPAARKWLQEFAKGCPGYFGEDEARASYSYPSYDRLIELGWKAVHNGYGNVDSAMSLQDHLNDHLEEFWENWSIITGHKVDPNPDVEDDWDRFPSFSCSC
jgi:uncharacterized protein (TIGR02996 family)